MSYLLRTCPGAWGVYTVCTRVHTRPGVPNWRPELGPQCVPNLGSRSGVPCEVPGVLYWGLEFFSVELRIFFSFLLLRVGMHVERMMFLVG